MLKINPDFVLRRIFDKYLLFPIRKNNISNEVIYLKGSAKYIFQFIGKSKTRNELISMVTSQYSNDNKNDIEKSIKQFIDLLIDKKFLIMGS